jgi:hypothetical protein
MITFIQILAVVTIFLGIFNMTGIIAISWLWFLIPVGFIAFVIGSVVYALHAMGNR